MRTVIEIAAQIVLCLTTLSVYTFLLISIIPKYFFKVKYDMSDHLGRGLEKFVYPDGRAVTYEPHPSIRKYVRKYALLTVDGYKYLQLSVGAGVKKYSARVIVYDNKNRIVDTLEISENFKMSSLSNPIRLDERTSYIAFILDEVNGKQLKKSTNMQVSVYGMLSYFAAVFVLTLLEFMHISATINGVAKVIDSAQKANISYAFAIIPALTVGVLCLAATVIDRIRKGVKVVLK